ncbi:MAG: heavy metal translocating P-type ATPase [Devosia sp.]|nr:heavy metal translocating P-type ATPase [Devosia sp.]
MSDVPPDMQDGKLAPGATAAPIGAAASPGPRTHVIATVPLPALLLALVALLGVVAGVAAFLLGYPVVAAWVWGVASAPVLIALLVEVAVALPQGRIGLDVLAGLSMAVALGFGEPLAANVVGLMYAGGQLLERYAEGHARREMTSLLGRVATSAMRYVDHALQEVPIERLGVGDRLLIRHGEVLPVDGAVLSGPAILDESALTGEALPITRQAGEEALSGSTLVGPAFDLLVKRPAAESTYAGIVRLVEKAQQSRAPMVRLADRYAVGFLVFSVALAGLAWLLSGDSQRFLAVLVIATPCPLILAVPVAIISGMSNAARAGALFKDGAAMERMAQITVAVLDKTGTLTHGLARVRAIHAVPEIGEARLLQLAASLDQASSHVVARALVAEAAQRGLPLTPPQAVSEAAGAGIEGMVEACRVAVGGDAYVRERSLARDADLTTLPPHIGELSVLVAVDGVFAGQIVLADEVRGEAAQLLGQLRAAGVQRIVLASGDRREIAEAAGKALGVDETLYELSPSAKAEAITRERRRGPVMMVGDGVNDAPALAAADVGVAMGARGAAASSEAASVVVLVDRLEPLAKAMVIARRTRRIAFESIFIGLGLSVGGMVLASFGLIEPVWGAMLQEVIDVAVILNALRALRDPTA